MADEPVIPPPKVKPSRRYVNAQKDKRREVQRKVKERRQFAKHVAAQECTVCMHFDKDEIEKKYMQWWTLPAIVGEYGCTKRDLAAHSQVYGWEKQRAEYTDPLYVRLINDIAEHFDARKLAPKDAIKALGMFARHVDRLQGRIIDHHKVESDKTVTFIAIPMPGGQKPLSSELNKEALVKGRVLELESADEAWEGTEESGSGELLAIPSRSGSTRETAAETQEGSAQPEKF